MRGSAHPSSSPPHPLDRVEIRGLCVDCVVGVYPSERERLQPLGLDLTLHLDTRKAASSGHLADTVDYARVAGDLRFILEHARFLLLEVAAEALCRYLLAPPATGAQIDEVSLTLRKPQALGGQGVASLSVRRSAAEYPLTREAQPYGALDRIFKDPHVGLTRLHLNPGAIASIAAPDAFFLILSEGLRLTPPGRPMEALRAGTGLRGGAPELIIHNSSPFQRALLSLHRTADPPPSAPPDRAFSRSFYYPEACP